MALMPTSTGRVESSSAVVEYGRNDGGGGGAIVKRSVVGEKERVGEGRERER
jgi:hypothetical protein